MRLILFVCTGNYYRSRTAEILFNHHAVREGIPVRAVSRGFRLNPEKNKGTLSPHALAYLGGLKIGYHGTPTRLDRTDMEMASRVIVLDEKEHRPMMQRLFPEWEEQVEYWQFEDDYLVDPKEILPVLHRRVEALVLSMRTDSPVVVD